jgi:serine/threonine protein phosphatase PrpC
MPSWLVTVFTHRGVGRAVNQDAIGINNRVFVGDMSAPEVLNVSDEMCAVILADGIGGHVHGAVASSEAASQFARMPASVLVEQQMCVAAIRQTNSELYGLMRQIPETQGMGTTLVGAAVSAESIAIFNVGDSPAFIHQPGQLLEITSRDVPTIKIGASKSKSTHQITQSLGGTAIERSIAPHFTSLRPNWSQDLILLCSDGLTDTVDDQTIAAILDKSVNPEDTVAALYREARMTGGQDDVSIVLVKNVEPTI